MVRMLITLKLKELIGIKSKKKKKKDIFLIVKIQNEFALIIYLWAILRN